MPLRTWNGSSFNTAKSAKVWNGSSWVNAKSAKVWNGSSWVNFLSSVNIEDASEVRNSAQFDSAFASAGYALNSDGTAETFSDGDGGFFSSPLTGQWFVGGSISDFSAKATITLSNGSGQEYTTGTFDTWLSLSTSREWAVVTNAFGNDDFQFATIVIRIDIAYTADTSTVIDSAFIQLEVTAQTI